MNKFSTYCFIILLGLFYNTGNAQKVSFSGQAAGWLTVNPETPFVAQTGLRYIPLVRLMGLP